MTVFYYDKTFEGLLSALFDAYDRKMFPDRLLAQGAPPPLFTENIHEVNSDGHKSSRVWKGLRRKLSGNICRMLICVWLSETEGADELLFRYMRKIFDRKDNVVMDFADDDMFEVKKLGEKVSREARYYIQFIRFQKASDGTFFAPLSPQYNVLPLTLSYFKDRFADQKWFLYDLKRKYGYYYDLKKVTEVTLDNDQHLIDGKLNDDIMAKDEKLFQERWKGYFKSMAIKERINPKLQRQNMPRRFWKYLTEMQ